MLMGAPDYNVYCVIKSSLKSFKRMKKSKTFLGIEFIVNCLILKESPQYWYTVVNKIKGLGNELG